MALTVRGGLIVPELLADAVEAAFAGMTVMGDTGAAIFNPTLPTEKRGGDQVKVPYFGAFSDMTDTAEGTALTPQALTMSSSHATVIHSGNAAQITNWAQIAASYADPYAEIGRQLVVTARRRFDKALIDVMCDADGSVTGVTALPGSQLLDTHITTGTITAAQKMSYATIVNMLDAYGDEQDDIAGFVMRSETLTEVRNIVDGYGRPLFYDQKDGGMPTLLGFPIFKTNRLPKDTSVSGYPKYTTALVKKSALALWSRQTAPETLNDPLTDSTIIATHVYAAPYRFDHVAGHTKPGVVLVYHN